MRREKSKAGCLEGGLTEVQEKMEVSRHSSLLEETKSEENLEWSDGLIESNRLLDRAVYYADIGKPRD